MNSPETWCQKCAKFHDELHTQLLIDNFMTSRGFRRESGYWIHSVGIKVRNRRALEWIRHLDTDNANRRMSGMVDYLIRESPPETRPNPIRYTMSGDGKERATFNLKIRLTRAEVEEYRAYGRKQDMTLHEVLMSFFAEGVEDYEARGDGDSDDDE